MSTASGSSGPRVACTWSADMLHPVLVPVDLAPHRGVVGLLDPAGDGTGTAVADGPLVHGRDGDHLGRGAGEEGLFGGGGLGPEEVGHPDRVAEGAGGCDGRVPGE